MIPIIPEPLAYLIFLHLLVWIAQGYYNNNWNPLKMYKRPKKEED